MYPGGNHSYNSITAALKSQLNMSVGVKVKGAIEMLWIIIKIHEKALQGRTGTSWEMDCSQPAGKAEDRMLIEMLFLKITMTSTFISSALCWSCLYNWDYIRCDEQMCSERGWAVLGKVELAARLVAKAPSVGILTFSALSLCIEAFKWNFPFVFYLWINSFRFWEILGQDFKNI